MRRGSEPATENTEPELRRVASFDLSAPLIFERVNEVLDVAGFMEVWIAGEGNDCGVYVERGSTDRVARLLRRLRSDEELDIKFPEEKPGEAWAR